MNTNLHHAVVAHDTHNGIVRIGDSLEVLELMDDTSGYISAVGLRINGALCVVDVEAGTVLAVQDYMAQN